MTTEFLWTNKQNTMMSLFPATVLYHSILELQQKSRFSGKKIWWTRCLDKKIPQTLYLKVCNDEIGNDKSVWYVQHTSNGTGTNTYFLSYIMVNKTEDIEYKRKTNLIITNTYKHIWISCHIEFLKLTSIRWNLEPNFAVDIYVDIKWLSLHRRDWS